MGFLSRITDVTRKLNAIRDALIRNWRWIYTSMSQRSRLRFGQSSASWTWTCLRHAELICLAWWQGLCAKSDGTFIHRRTLAWWCTWTWTSPYDQTACNGVWSLCSFPCSLVVSVTLGMHWSDMGPVWGGLVAPMRLVDPCWWICWLVGTWCTWHDWVLRIFLSAIRGQELNATWICIIESMNDVIGDQEVLSQWNSCWGLNSGFIAVRSTRASRLFLILGLYWFKKQGLVVLQGLDRNSK